MGGVPDNQAVIQEADSTMANPVPGFIMQKRIGFKNGTHVSVTFVAALCCSLAGKEWGMGTEVMAGWGYYVPFVGGLALFWVFVLCQACGRKANGNICAR